MRPRLAFVTVPFVCVSIACTGGLAPNTPRPADDDRERFAASAPAPAAELRTSGPRCSGHAPADTPHEACCYPERESLLAPVRAVFPAMRACYEAIPAPRPEASFVVRFHVAADGTVDEACSETSLAFDSAFADCALAAIRTAHFAPRSADDVKVCGLVRVVYPVRFSR